MTDGSHVARLTTLAARQHGLVTTNQLRHLGFDKSTTSRLSRHGWLHRIAHCVYAVGHVALAEDGVLLAAVMTYGPEAHLSGASAVARHGLLPPWELPSADAPVDVTVPPHVRVAPRRDTVLHRSALPPAHRGRIGPLPIVTVDRALLDVAPAFSRRRLERAIDQAVVDRRTDPARLLQIVADSRGVVGVTALREVVDGAQRYATLTRSELEEALLRLVRAAGLPDPELNVRVRGIFGRFDAWWPGPRTGVEVDGWAWHRTGARQHADRLKELQARQAGITLLRYSARQVFEQPLPLAADLGVALAGRRAA